MKISIIGAGYVGLVTGACLAELGHHVTCMDSDRSKMLLLKANTMPIYEPGLGELVRRNRKSRRLGFTSRLDEAVEISEIIFIAVGTPSRENGAANLTYVENVARQIAEAMTGYRLIVEKSTVPVATGEWIERTIRLHVKKGIEFDVASNPEFLREGSAVQDFLHPDRIVLGVESGRARDILTRLYKPLKAPLVVTDMKSAELIKHASNSFLATKVSFINAVANLCDQVGADVHEVSRGMGLDRRIGPDFLEAGIGFGGSCFPKDLAAFVKISEDAGVDFTLLKSVSQINKNQRQIFLKRIEENLWNVSGKTIGVLGLAFKPNTDDLREAPSLEVIAWLRKEGARIRAYDPQAMPKARQVLKGITFVRDAYQAAQGADALVIVTGWDEFRKLDLKKIKEMMKYPLVLDGRNIYSPAHMKELGFRYVGIGRPQKPDRRG
ncbi:MAG: UDP-glucose/GDP-mannose dehydrogenase family protein [Candidatus Omnitrophica bacterium]|nr:UDP-glucose/GDP-mannose dehydrogenase family protein [Candidatus Omnitrophota bacterium]